MNLLPINNLRKLSLLNCYIRDIDALLFPCSANLQDHKLGKYYHGYCKYISFNKIRNVPFINRPKVSFISSWPLTYSVALHHSKMLATYKLSNASGLLTSNGLTINNYRSKYTKKPQKRPEYDSDSDSDVEEDIPRGMKIATIRLQSLRMDGLLKKALNMARNKIETAFYEGSIRVNGKKPDKKSYQLRIGDEIDLIKGPSPMNAEYLNVSRVEVASVSEENDADELRVKVKVSKNLNIENYQSHPWKHSGSIE